MASSESNLLNTNPADVRVIQTNEKVTGPPAIEMIRRCGIGSESEPVQLLDNACGGGVVISEVLRMARKDPNKLKITRIVGSDTDERMLSYVRQRSEEAGLLPKVEVLQIDQQSVSLPDYTFSHVFNNFGIFFVPDDEAALSETFRIIKPGGHAGFTSWKSIDWWPSLVMPAISASIPEAPALPAPSTVFPSRGWNDPAAIPEKLKKAGFTDVQVSEYAFTPDVGAKEFAKACAILIKTITRRLWTIEQNQRFADQIEPALLNYLRENFPDGKWNGQMYVACA